MRLVVDKKYRKIAIATNLIIKLKDIKKNIFLEVRENNTAAIALYKKIGFKQTTIRKKYYRNGDNAKIFILQLNKLL